MSDMDLPADVEAAMKEPGRVFGRYVLLQQLGRGGMGTVYKAWQTPLKRYVAIKILHEGESDDNLARFMREAQTASQVQHQNIASVYEVGQHNGRFFIAMQYVDGLTLDALFQRKLEREKLLKILRAAALAVHAAHLKDVVHRDIKPSNIMLSKEGRPYVLDFGIARRLHGGDTLTEAGMVVGTPTYMAPEQASGNPEMVDRRSDIWSLGVILYEILTGAVPFRGRTPAETLMFLVNQDAPPPSKRARDVPRELEAVCLKALERERRRRYATAEEFGLDVQRWLDGTAVSAKPLTMVERLSRRMKRYRARIVATVCLLVLTGAGAAGWAVVRRIERERTRGAAREAMGREKWAEALRLWERLGDDAEAAPKARECQERLDAMQRSAGLRAGQEHMDASNEAYRNAMKVIDVAGQHEKLRSFLREAEDRARKALREHDRDAQWWMKLGRILYELRDAGCIHAFSRALELDATLVDAYYLRAKMNMARCFDGILLENMSVHAIEALHRDVDGDLKRGIEKGLNPDRALLLTILELTYQEKFAEAQVKASSMYDRAAEDLEILEVLGQLSLRSKSPKRAEECFEKLSNVKRPNSALFRLHWSAAAIIRGDIETALKRLREGLSWEGDDPTIRYRAARLLLNIDANEAALKEFETIVERDPKNYAALAGKAMALERLKRHEAAKLTFAAAAEGKDALSDDLYVICLVQGDNLIQAISESEGILTRLSTLGSPSATRVRTSIHGLRGAAYRKLKKPENALAELERAISLGSKEPLDYFGAADMLLDLQRDVDLAERYLKQAIALDKANRHSAWAEYCTKRLEKARRHPR